MDCQIVINKDSGNAKRLRAEDIIGSCTSPDDKVTLTYIDKNTDWSALGYDRIFVCGGDGTLHNTMKKLSANAEFTYVPCGTLNETASSQNEITKAGKIGGEFFTYVAAAGSFTEIGYNTPDCKKRKFKFLAYLSKVLKYYKAHEINVTLNADGKTYSKNVTLLMFLRSDRCFNFKFNKLYKKRQGLYLLAVSSFGKDGFLSRLRMFFPFFRIFFLKMRRESVKKDYIFLPFKEVTVDLPNPVTFCLDGEKAVFSGTLKVAESDLNKHISVCDAPYRKRNNKKSDNLLK